MTPDQPSQHHFCEDPDCRPCRAHDAQLTEKLTRIHQAKYIYEMLVGAERMGQMDKALEVLAVHAKWEDAGRPEPLGKRGQ